MIEFKAEITIEENDIICVFIAEDYIEYFVSIDEALEHIKYFYNRHKMS